MSRLKAALITTGSVLILFAGMSEGVVATGAARASAGPLFENSVVSNDIDFIMVSDPATPGCLRYLGQSSREMPGALDADELIAAAVYTFEVEFADQSQVGIWVHPSVGTRQNAEELADLFVRPLGQLPTVMRQRLSHLVIHSGYHAAFGEHLGHFFVMYADNVRARIATHDLEETVFHEVGARHIGR